ncbi:MAG: FAD-binding protein [Myxococcota bacterium]
MRAHLFRLVLRQYVEHRHPANLRLHQWSNALLGGGLLVALSQVPVPFPVPLLGANLGAAFLVASVLYWLWLDPLVPAMVLGFGLALAHAPGVPWGPGHGLLVGGLVPVAVLTFGGLAALFSHVYHHEHAPYLRTDHPARDRLETAHSVAFGLFHFPLIALLRAGYRPGLRAAFDRAERALLMGQGRRTWSNWAGTVTCRATLRVPQTLADLAACVGEATRAGVPLRVVGAGFSWSSWSATDGYLVFGERLTGVELDLAEPERPAAWVLCGTTNRELDAALARAGYQLPWNVVMETVTVGGIVSLGTHGSGKDTATLGDLVLAFDVIDAAGRRRVLSEDTIGADGMAAARLSAGRFGVIARVRLRLEPAHRVLQRDRKLPFDQALAELPALVRAATSVELFWFPFCDWAWIRTFDRTDLPRSRFGPGLAYRVRHFVDTALLLGLVRLVTRAWPSFAPIALRSAAWSLSFRDRVVTRTEAVHYRHWLEARRSSCVEVGFKADPDFANVARAIRETRARVDAWAAQGRYPLDLNLNVRFVGESGALLSPAYGPGLTCYVEALCLGRGPHWRAFSAELCAAWLADPTALPHWAKEFEHVPGLRELVRARLGARLDRFAAALRASGIDPDERFANPVSRWWVPEAPTKGRGTSAHQTATTPRAAPSGIETRSVPDVRQLGTGP